MLRRAPARNNHADENVPWNEIVRTRRGLEPATGTAGHLPRYGTNSTNALTGNRHGSIVGTRINCHAIRHAAPARSPAVPPLSAHRACVLAARYPALCARLSFGADPLDAGQLRYVYEGKEGESLRALPTMANVLAYPGFWAREPDTGITWQKLLHAEQEIRIHAPLPPSGRVTGTTRITGPGTREKTRARSCSRRATSPMPTPAACLRRWCN